MLDTHKLFESVLADDFILCSEGPLNIYYAPFDHIIETAHVILFGVAPGWTLMKLAFETVVPRSPMARVICWRSRR